MWYNLVFRKYFFVCLKQNWDSKRKRKLYKDLRYTNLKAYIMNLQTDNTVFPILY